MNPQVSNSRFRTALYWCGALFCFCFAAYLAITPKYVEFLKPPINPLALRLSPYGMLLSSLLQQPINVEWHKGIETVETKEESDDDHEHKTHDHDKEEPAKQSQHHHAAGEDCDICDAAAGRSATRINNSLLPALAMKLQQLAATHSARTNPKPISPAHQLYIARNIEKKLLVAYNLDPMNYAAYDAYFFFLTENVVNGLGSLDKVKQAQIVTTHTLEHCNKELVSPLPALTAALATFNRFMLNLSLGNPKDDDFNRMLAAEVSKQLLKYEHLKALAISNGNWQLAPEAWRVQADERAYFVRKLAKSLAEKPANKVSK